ncbi:hypothetical protein LTR62_006422 [Meristemomyces frigidus]|uniref:Arrestin-like N-terminal domain-containing protein n=1 Tax=Meristemomyces frigidus TaxID=1508187 RepID=A0AAN7TDH8_9PEZI|nr:hypothetical protein LTR62_006422 [Meristemomyces frigidus]
MALPMAGSSSGPGADNGTDVQRLKNIIPGRTRDPTIKINLTSAKKKIYTTSDKFEGTVSIECHADTPFDEISIELAGTARTYVERMATAAAMSGRSQAFHRFMTLEQPGLKHLWPADRILRVGITYEFAFAFTVPTGLLPRTCTHTVSNDAVREAHLLLPPTFGDKEQAKIAKLQDDLAPDMASVRYGLFVQIFKYKQTDQGLKSVLITGGVKARRLRIIPMVEVLPPLAVGYGEGDYHMRQEKRTKPGMFKGKTGTLTIEAEQPQALIVDTTFESDYPVSTMATVSLRFDPLDQKITPPGLGNIATKLKVSTFFSSTARSQFPSKSAATHDLSQGIHSEQLNLSARCVNNVEWEKRGPARSSAAARRDSANSTISPATTAEGPNNIPIPAPSLEYRPEIAYYTARVLVPITLPENKFFVPTFHSCLLSRSYQLKLELGLAGFGAGSLSLKLPIQIAALPLESAPAGGLGRTATAETQTGTGTATDEDEYDGDDVWDFFEPRSMTGAARPVRRGSLAPPVVGGVGSDDVLPDYSPYVPSAGGRRGSGVVPRRRSSARP